MINHIRDTQGLYHTFINLLNQRNKGELNFIVIGAMDGKTHDPLYHKIIENSSWRGLFIEPLHDMYARLLQTYHENRDRFQFIQCAVTDKDDSFTITRVPIENVGITAPLWADGISTLVPQKHIMSKDANLFSQTVEESVQGYTLKTIESMYHLFDQTNIFQCDTEGCDINIVKQLIEMMPESISPEILHFESVYMSEEEKNEVSVLLTDKGYNTYFDSQNMVAIQK